MTSTSSALRPLCSRAVALARCTTDPGAGPPVALSALARTRIGAAAPFGVPVRMSAAAPSPIGEHIGSVSGSVIIRLDSTSSTVIVLRNWATGLWTAWRRFFTTTCAKSAALQPWRSMRPRARSA